MYLHRLKLQNFRNYRDLEITLEPGRYFLVGDNGQGKTNFLEAVYFSSTGRTALTSHLEHLVAQGQTRALIEAEFQTKNPEQVVIQLDASGEKWIKFNHKNLNRLSDLVGKIPVVFLLPGDLELIQGGPQNRRDFLDEVLCGESPRYLGALLDYHRILKQKSAYLRNLKIHKQTADQTLISSFNQTMLEPATLVFLQRQKVIQEFQTQLRLLYGGIFPAKHEVLLQYVSDVGASQDGLGYRRGLEALQERSFSSEVKMGRSLVGPHHDDMQIFISGQNARHFASNGQKRLLSLALRLAQGLIFEHRENPIYLLDDVLLELDNAHRAAVLNFLNRSQQVFLTTTSTHWVSPDILSEARILQVKSGHVVTS